MLLNSKLMATTGKFHYMIIEKWPGASPADDYFQQAKALRRHIEGIGYIERGFRDGVVALALLLAGNQGTAQLICVDGPEHFAEYVGNIPTQVPPAADDRLIVTMGNWDMARKGLVHMISTMRKLAGEEATYGQQRKVRPLPA